MSDEFWDDGFDEDDDTKYYDADLDLIELVHKRYGKIRFYGSDWLLPKGYKPCARIACSNDIGLVYGFYIAYINPKRNKFTIRYTSEYDPWGYYHLQEYKEKKK